MFRVNSDFEFLHKLFLEFFKQKHITKQLNQIDELDISGWEVWLQVELYIFLRAKQEKKEINEVVREFRYEIDQRSTYFKETNKSYCAIDFEIMKRNAKSNKWIPIEVKQSIKASDCIRNISRDLDKYLAIKESEKKLGDFRYPFFLGVFKSRYENRDEDISAIEKYAKTYEFDRVEVIDILDTNYFAVLL